MKHCQIVSTFYNSVCYGKLEISYFCFEISNAQNQIISIAPSFCCSEELHSSFFPAPPTPKSPHRLIMLMTFLPPLTHSCTHSRGLDLSQEVLTGLLISALRAVATSHTTMPTKFKAFSISN